jgi:hypothetical protein
MSLTDQINDDIKSAMKAREKERLGALRDIKSKLLLEMTKDGSDTLDDEVGLKVLNKLYKQRIEAAEIYQTQGREDLESQERAEAEYIKVYLPEPLSEDEIRASLKSIIEETGASSMADMGKVMGMATKAFAGKADGKIVSGIVRELLN